jgi:hypothetical protein
VFESHFNFCFDNGEGKHPPSQVHPDSALPHTEGEASSLTLNVGGSCFSSPSHRNLENYQWHFIPSFLLSLSLCCTLFLFFISTAERAIREKGTIVDLCKSSHIKELKKAKDPVNTNHT